MHDLSLRPDQSLLVLVDVQDRLLAAMDERQAASLVNNASILLETASTLGVPVIVTEQYPKGLGRTAPALLARLSSANVRPVVEKLEFDASENSEFQAILSETAGSLRRQVVLAGMEAHICVYQTARGLLAKGFGVHVVADATASRPKAAPNADNEHVARRLWERSGAVVTSTETVAFDWVGRAGTDAFKIVSKLVR